MLLGLRPEVDVDVAVADDRDRARPRSTSPMRISTLRKPTPSLTRTTWSRKPSLALPWARPQPTELRPRRPLSRRPVLTHRLHTTRHGHSSTTFLAKPKTAPRTTARSRVVVNGAARSNARIWKPSARAALTVDTEATVAEVAAEAVAMLVVAQEVDSAAVAAKVPPLRLRTRCSMRFGCLRLDRVASPSENHGLEEEKFMISMDVIQFCMEILKGVPFKTLSMMYYHSLDYRVFSDSVGDGALGWQVSYWFGQKGRNHRTAILIRMGSAGVWQVVAARAAVS